MAFIYKDSATTDIFTLSLHDALPILLLDVLRQGAVVARGERPSLAGERLPLVVDDRKSTRLNSSHVEISYAVFCLKKKKATALPLFHRSASKSNELAVALSARHVDAR